MRKEVFKKKLFFRFFLYIIGKPCSYEIFKEGYLFTLEIAEKDNGCSFSYKTYHFEVGKYFQLAFIASVKSQGLSLIDHNSISFTIQV